MKAIRLRTFSRTFNLITALLILTAMIHAVIYVDAAPGQAQAASPIEVLEQSTQSDFGKTMTFSVRARSSAGKIVSAMIHTRLPSQSYDFVEPVEDLVPAKEVGAEHIWNMERAGLPPWLIVQYRWEFKDSAGNVLITPVSNAEIADDTRTWEKLSDNKIAVYTYKQAPRFSKDLFAAAQKAFQHIANATGHTPAYEIRVVIFNNQKDFCAFQGPNDCIKWAAGQTYPGLTVQWIDNARDPSRQFLLKELIPHELAHAFLHEWAKPRLGVIPSWFDEGQAMNNQLDGIDFYIRRARGLARANKLRRITGMGSVGYIPPSDLVKIRDWYAQATALVAYLYQKWGVRSLGKIVNFVNDGDTFEVAWKKVTGLTLEEYETEWRKWLGATKPLPTLLPTATMVPLPGS
jgi:hypothetical protein